MTLIAPLWPQKIKKLHALYILSDFIGIKNLSSLNDLNSLNSLSGLNDIDSFILSIFLLNLMFPSTLVPKLPILVSQSSKIYYFIDF
jgi:hypothetical protein